MRLVILDQFEPDPKREKGSGIQEPAFFAHISTAGPGMGRFLLVGDRGVDKTLYAHDSEERRLVRIPQIFTGLDFFRWNENSQES